MEFQKEDETSPIRLLSSSSCKNSSAWQKKEDPSCSKSSTFSQSQKSIIRFTQTKMKLYYWYVPLKHVHFSLVEADLSSFYFFRPIKARNYATQAVAQAGGLQLELVSDFNFPELKPTLPFGQLPYLVDGDVKIAQSNAILRYVARKADLAGNISDAHYGLSEMLIEEANDLNNLLVKANYAGDKVAAYNELFAEGGAA